MPETALRAVRAMIGAAPARVEVRADPDWGPVLVVTLDAPASAALRANLELQRALPGVPVVVRWAGPTDVGENELAERLAEIARAGGFRARMPCGLNAVREVAEGRENAPLPASR